MWRDFIISYQTSSTSLSQLLTYLTCPLTFGELLNVDCLHVPNVSYSTFPILSGHAFFLNRFTYLSCISSHWIAQILPTSIQTYQANVKTIKRGTASGVTGRASWTCQMTAAGVRLQQQLRSGNGRVQNRKMRKAAMNDN